MPTVVQQVGDCTKTTQYDANGFFVQACLDCPEVAAVPAVPAQTIVDRQLGWNSGARSGVSIIGDCYTQFTVPAHAVGVVCGLAPARNGTDPANVPHAFYVYQDAGRELWCVVEGGIPKTAPVARGDDLFRIERRAGVVRYFVNNRRVYVSAAPARAPLMVVACLYAAFDGID